MLSRLLKVSSIAGHAELERLKLTWGYKVIARNALAQEESQDFNPDFPETIPINIGEENQGCAC